MTKTPSNSSEKTVTKMSTGIGKIGEFNPQEEAIESYVMRLKHFFKANNISDDSKVSILITVLGPKILAILSDIVSPSEVDSKTYEELVKALRDYFSPKKLVVAERYTFYSRVQKQTESISEFVVAIKHLSSTCKFNSFLKDALRDKLISGIHNEVIRQKLLSEDQTFDEAFEFALRLEQAEKQTNMFTQKHEVCNLHVKRGKSNCSSMGTNNRANGAMGGRPSGNHNYNGHKVKCYRCCSLEHKANECPYSSYKCNGCNMVGHLLKACRSRNKHNKQFPKHGKMGKVGLHQMMLEEDRPRPNTMEKAQELCLYNLGLNNGTDAYKVPYSLSYKVEQELERMVSEGIAYRVTSSEWATPLVVVDKPNGVRLCADFKVTLNQVLQTEHYPLPQPEDIFASLSGCTYFSVLDLASAYQQLAVAEESQPLLTLTTHKGLFRLRRLPYGLASAPAIFQAAIDQIVSGLPGTVAYLDDVLVGGPTREEAYVRLGELLERLQMYGVRVNESKCKFLQSEVEYLGYVISATGISPQQSIVSAIQNAPEPTNKDELRAYVGLLNYYGKFINNLSAKLHCFYELLRKDAPWTWTEQCSRTFKESKSWVLSSNILVHYDVKKRLVLTCDASPKGVSAILSHIVDGEERPIAFASKTLSTSEKNYSQLHKEALALVFGVKKFHKYIYGRKNCVLQSDHQPLAAIFGSKRGVPSLAAARLQRWALILSAYNFDVKYRKGSDLPHADALSRLPLPEDEPLELEDNYISHVESWVEVMNFFSAVSDDQPITSRDVGNLTDKDPLLSKVKDYVLHGWRDVQDPRLVPFQRRRDESSVDKNCILWGSRVVIPDKLQGNVIQMLHDQHPGITRMKLLARSYVWWPGIEKYIEDTVSSCHICQSTRNASPRVPLQQWPLTSERWRRVHIDFAEDTTTRQQMLILVDSFSKWIEVFLMGSTSAAKTIERLRTLFSAYGLPEELVSDNGSSFTSLEFREFLRKNGIRFTLTPPYHPASNGAAERCVQEVKKGLFRQVLSERSTQLTSLQYKLDNFLFAYRNTPTSVTGVSPAELFLRWKPRTKLAMLKPNLQEDTKKRQEMQKCMSDKHRGSPRYFSEGQNVMVKTVKQEKVSWVPGKILQCKSPVTYLVSVLGRTRFCYADHLKPNPVEDDDIIVQRKENCVMPEQQESVRVSPQSIGLSPRGKSLSSPSKMGGSPPPPPLSRAEDPLSPSGQKSDVEGKLRDMRCSPTPVLRRSQRAVRKPEKLNL